jgi:hypothetical protein
MENQIVIERLGVPLAELGPARRRVAREAMRAAESQIQGFLKGFFKPTFCSPAGVSPPEPLTLPTGATLAGGAGFCVGATVQGVRLRKPAV